MPPSMISPTARTKESILAALNHPLILLLANLCLFITQKIINSYLGMSRRPIEVWITPKSDVFAIWGVIDLMLLVMCGYGLVSWMLGKAEDVGNVLVQERIGWLFGTFDIYIFFFGGFLNVVL